ncbi:3'-5' exonuclease [Wenzhouxiangella sp. XN79A]|uniref:3'-5' exonuclease n=1 Tax=Wenzhouxiangella sp. XN79A TaxID=2724193 RepID=UPI00144AE1A0|nr:3'-5' exonuclease [Wenzhouxiangella sp. XN79A]NKI34459.1 3'-5' exonuclease [Wenzhouxiangella sp. XN79A]
MPATVFHLLALLLLVPVSGAAQSPWPDNEPGDWGLAIIDVETTGLEPGYHEMIDIGMIYTTLDGEELDRLFLRIHPRHPERAGDVARSINGYSEQRWAELDALLPAQAVERILDFHRQHADPRRFILTAYNAPFDRAFLDALLTEHGSTVRDLYTWFVLDLPSMAFGLGATALVNDRVAERFGLEPETDDPLDHTGLSGAEWNLALYRAMRQTSRELSVGPDLKP